jgi:hypothetical protein
MRSTSNWGLSFWFGTDDQADNWGMEPESTASVVCGVQTSQPNPSHSRNAFTALATYLIAVSWPTKKYTPKRSIVKGLLLQSIPDLIFGLKEDCCLLKRLSRLPAITPGQAARLHGIAVQRQGSRPTATIGEQAFPYSRRPVMRRLVSRT